MPESDPFLKQIGKRLKQLRQNAKLTQVQLAKTVELDYRHYQNLEAGHSNFKITTIKKLADFYGISIANFFEDQAFQSLELRPQQILLNNEDPQKFTMELIDRYRSKWDSLDIGVQVYSRDGLLLFVNNFWANLLKTPKAEIENKMYFWEFIEENKREHMKEYHRFLMESNPPPKTYMDEGIVPHLHPYQIRAEWDYLYESNTSDQVVGNIALMWPVRAGTAATEITAAAVH